MPETSNIYTLLKFSRTLVYLYLVLIHSNDSYSQVNFSTRRFHDGFDTSNSIFPDSCIFYKEGPEGHIRSRSEFISTASFTNDIFQNKVDFRRIHFSNDILFNKTIFANSVDFTRDTFNSVADFSDVKFLGGCHFILANFQNYLDFTRTSFQGIAYFSNLNLSDTCIIDFNEAVLPDTLDFSENPKLPLEINLSNASYTSPGLAKRKIKKHCIFLKGSDISKFRLDYKYFNLIFIDPKTRKEISEDEKEAVYESLLKNFLDRGQLESHKLLDIEFNDYQWSKKMIPLRWLGVFPHWWNFYGHEKELVFFWTFVFLLLFTMITFKHLDHLIQNVYPMANITDYQSLEDIKKTGTRKDHINLYGKRFWNSFIYTSTIFFLFSLNVQSFKFKYKKAAFFLILVYTVGIICIAYMANFVIAR
jgi:hypothetical protein